MLELFGGIALVFLAIGVASWIGSDDSSRTEALEKLSEALTELDKTWEANDHSNRAICEKLDAINAKLDRLEALKYVDHPAE